MVWRWPRDDVWEGLHFKRVSEGWIFRSPVSWTFGLGPRRHYLVSEAQKADIERVLAPDRRFVTLVVIVPLVIFLMLLLTQNLPVWGDRSLPLFLGIFFISWCAMIVESAYCWFVLRSTLAGVPRTRARIRLIEQLSIIAANTPQGKWTLGALLFLLLLALWVVADSLYHVLILRDLVSSLISIAVMGLFGLYCFALLVLKFKRSREVG